MTACRELHSGGVGGAIHVITERKVTADAATNLILLLVIVSTRRTGNSTDFTHQNQFSSHAETLLSCIMGRQDLVFSVIDPY